MKSFRSSKMYVIQVKLIAEAQAQFPVIQNDNKSVNSLLPDSELIVN